MPHLTKVTLSEVPIEQRVREALRLAHRDPSSTRDLILAALNPSDKCYHVSREAHDRVLPPKAGDH